MSKLEKIREALKNNPNINIVGVQDENYLPFGFDRWDHSVYFFIAPKINEFNVQKLQDIMVSMVPELASNFLDNFREDDRHLYFGYLQFEEEIGKRITKTEVILSDREMFPTKGFYRGRRIINQKEKLQRIIRLKLFPSNDIASKALVLGENKYSIPKKELTVRAITSLC